MSDNKKTLSSIIPFQFRIWAGNKEKTKYSVLWYIDARDAMELLDDVVWPNNWQRDHKKIWENLFCWIGINHWWERVWKWDCGTESNTEKEKWESSDSFKRACVNWGIWRFLYTLPKLWITAEEANKNKFNITEFVKTKHKEELKRRHDTITF